MNEYRELVPTKKTHVLVLRKVSSNMTSYGGFKWPSSGPVEALDWDNKPKCGGGLHGLPWGEGSVGLLDGDIWMCCLVNTDDGYIYGDGDLTDKCKFKRAEDVSIGSKEEVIANIVKYAPKGARVNFATQTAVDRSTQTAGNMSTQTAWDRSTQTAGDWSTQTAWYRSTQTAGDRSTQTAGNMSTQTAGNMSTQTAGNMSTQTAGDGTVQITRWYENGKLKTACRIVTKEQAGKTFFVKDGVWTEVKS
jgi:hypothetical protein